MVQTQNVIVNSAAAAKSLQSVPTLCDPITAAHQTPRSLGCSRQEHWSGCRFCLRCMKVKRESGVAQSIVNTRRRYFTTEADGDANTNFLYHKPPLAQFLFKNKKYEKLYLFFSPAKSAWLYCRGATEGQGKWGSPQEPPSLRGVARS